MEHAENEGVSKILKHYNQGDDILQQLNEFRRSGHLCDVFLVAEGREFPAHRAVLAATQGFFRGLFAASMKEQSAKKIELHQVDPDVVEDMLNYIYTGEIKLTPVNAENVLLAADFLLLENLKAPLDEFLAQTIQEFPASDLLSSLQFSRRYECQLLEKEIVKMVRKSFEAVVTSTSEGFLELSAPMMEEIIAGEDLVASSEEFVFKALVNWARHKENRKDSFYKLFSHIRLCALSEDFLHSTVLKEELVSSNSDCHSLVIRSTKMKYLPTTANVPHPRYSMDQHVDAIFVCPFEMSVFTPLENLSLSFYTPYTNSWYLLPCRESHVGGKLVYYKGSIFSANYGNDNTELVINRYDIQQNTWSEIANIALERSCWNFAVTCVNGIIYVVGDVLSEGGASRNDIYSCDVTGLVSPEYEPCYIEPVQTLTTGRGRPCVVSDNNHVYVLGGFEHFHADRLRPSLTNKVERFDPETNSWTYLSPMPHEGVMGNASTLVKDKIFINKGYDCDVYDISSDTWSSITGPPSFGNKAVLTACDDKLYLIGQASDDVRHQQDEDECVEVSCFVYDVKEDSWTDRSAFYKESPWSFGHVEFTSIAVRLPKNRVSSLQSITLADPYAND